MAARRQSAWVWFIALLFLLPARAPAGGAPAKREPQELSDLRAWFQAQCEEALKPLKTEYDKRLEDLEKTLIDKGDLDGARLVKKERETGGQPAPSKTKEADDEGLLRGSFYISVDDSAVIYVNGQQCYKAGLGESRSPELVLNEQDVVVANLNNERGPRRFKMVFLSTDRKKMICFRQDDYRDTGLHPAPDITARAVLACTKRVRLESKGKLELLAVTAGVKDFADWVWGADDQCMIATVIRKSMISRGPN